MSKNPTVVPAIPSKSHTAPSEWHDQTLVLELEALLDARKALMQELQVLDAEVAAYFARLLPVEPAATLSHAVNAPLTAGLPASSAARLSPARGGKRTQRTNAAA